MCFLENSFWLFVGFFFSIRIVNVPYCSWYVTVTCAVMDASPGMTAIPNPLASAAASSAMA